MYFFNARLDKLTVVTIARSELWQISKLMDHGPFILKERWRRTGDEFKEFFKQFRTFGVISRQKLFETTTTLTTSELTVVNEYEQQSQPPFVIEKIQQTAGAPPHDFDLFVIICRNEWIKTLQSQFVNHYAFYQDIMVKTFDIEKSDKWGVFWSNLLTITSHDNITVLAGIYPRPVIDPILALISSPLFGPFKPKVEFKVELTNFLSRLDSSSKVNTQSILNKHFRLQI